jgi:phospholipase/carboxylesterase
MLDVVKVQQAEQVKASIIWLHGLGADGHDFESIVPELKLPESLNIRFIFPHAPVRAVTVNGGYEMRAWYDIAGAAIERDPDTEGMRQSIDELNQLVENEIRQGISSHKIIIAGFSQGGAIALLAGLQTKQSLAGVLALSTYLPYMDQETQELIKMPYLMMHGTSDPIVPVALAKASCERLKEKNLEVEWCEYDMPHSLCQEQITKMSDWIQARLA